MSKTMKSEIIKEAVKKSNAIKCNLSKNDKIEIEKSNYIYMTRYIINRLENKDLYTSDIDEDIISRLKNCLIESPIEFDRLLSLKKILNDEEKRTEFNSFYTCLSPWSLEYQWLAWDMELLMLYLEDIVNFEIKEILSLTGKKH